MTDQRELDRLLDAYFVDGTDELADRVIQAALDQIDHTRQRRVLHVPWRFRPMTMPLRLGTAAVIGALVLGGAFLLTGGGSRPSTIPTPSASPGPIWSVTGSPPQDRGNAQIAIQLKDGRILHAGGLQPATADLYDPSTGTWMATGSFNIGRAYPIAARLADGRVLVAGGSEFNAASAELYDPATGAWTVTGSMATPRNQGFGILLADGRILAAGGGNDGGKASAELFDPATGIWASTGSLPAVRAGPLGITRLPDGRVLVDGGFADDKTSAEIYDPTTGTWTATGRMTTGRGDEQSAILMRDGRVLVCGGHPSSCDTYDATAGRFTPTGPLKAAYTDLLVLNQLADGSVLLVAGGGSGASATGFATAELFDPAMGTWTAVGEPLGATKFVRSAHTLPDGTVLVVGSDSTNAAGNPNAELYHPAP